MSAHFEIADDRVTARPFTPDYALPVVVEPAAPGSVTINAFVDANHERLREIMRRAGGVLLRGFGPVSPEEFRKVVLATCGVPVEYSEPSSPRTHIAQQIYTSTDYPPDQRIYLHNERSYAHSLPREVAFLCDTPSPEGGETPIADCRRILARIPKSVRDELVKRRYRYVRNFHKGLGLSWQTVLGTTDKGAAEEYCKAHDMEFEWHGDSLRTHSIRDVVSRHPETGEEAWINHMTFYHVSTLDEHLQDLVFEMFEADEDLPNNTYYGDGEPLDEDLLDDLRAAYEAETVAFPWVKGDVLLIDNLLVAHARRPYSGPRRILAALTNPIDWPKIAVRA